ncbi:MAG: hypothetical protein GY943_39395 [Chloroflexi bacterium]|nr:hypothetical protein [Chloroflexota bacterium]
MMAMYQFRVKGHLGQRFANAFAGLTIIRLPNGESTLTGPIVDQAALFGVLIRISDLGIPLLSVNKQHEGDRHLCEGVIK